MLSNRIKLAKVAKNTVPSILQITEICMAELNGDVTMEHLRVDVRNAVHSQYNDGVCTCLQHQHL